MSKSSVLMALTALFLLLLATPAVHAGKTSDGLTPAEESACDILRDGDYTRGLYGLCVAYCEAEARSARVLDSYDRKRTDADPEMPCLAEETAVCPCWTPETVVASGQSTSVLCELGELDEAAYIDFAVMDYEYYAADTQGCEYLYDPSLFDMTDAVYGVAMPYASAAEEGACRQDLATLCGATN